MSTAEIIAIIAIGIPILGCLILLIYRSGKVVQHITHIDTDIEEIKNVIKVIPSLMVKVGVLEWKVDELWKRRNSTKNSPTQLNDEGKNILKDSGVKKIIKEHLEQIIEDVKSKNPGNAYQAQEHIIEVVRQLKEIPSLNETLENGAFNSGVSVETVLYVGAVDIRDDILIQLDFKEKFI